jgi:hypothetical protein
MRIGAAALGLEFFAFFFADDLANCVLLKLKVSLALSTSKNRLLESDRIGNDAPTQGQEDAHMRQERLRLHAPIHRPLKQDCRPGRGRRTETKPRHPPETPWK